MRGGKRLSKKNNMAALVKSRLIRWKSDPDSLWKEAVERSKKPLVPSEPCKPKTEGSRLAQSVIAALRLGDVRKALQMLNSAPIAAKTPATLANLRKLHPMVKIQHPSRIRKSLALPKMLFAKLCALSDLVLLQAYLGINLFFCNNDHLFSLERLHLQSMSLRAVEHLHSETVRSCWSLNCA